MPALRSPRQPAAERAWFDSPLALELVRHVQRQATPLLTSHIGIRGLYLRPSQSVSSQLSGNMLQSTASLYREAEQLEGDVRCAPDALPFESDSLCLIYALHMLELLPSPEALVEECARALRPEGVLFLVCLSPSSPCRLRWAGSGLQAISEGRARFLLGGAGLQVEQCVGLGPVWPRLGASEDAAAVAAPSRWTPDALRASYLMIARKRRAGLTPIPPRKAKLALQPHAHAG